MATVLSANVAVSIFGASEKCAVACKFDFRDKPLDNGKTAYATFRVTAKTADVNKNGAVAAAMAALDALGTGEIVVTLPPESDGTLTARAALAHTGVSLARSIRERIEDKAKALRIVA